VQEANGSVIDGLGIGVRYPGVDADIAGVRAPERSPAEE